MNPDDIPLSAFEVDCDGSACGSGRGVGLHIHPPQDGAPAICRVIVRDSKRIRYEPGQGFLRLVYPAVEGEDLFRARLRGRAMEAVADLSTALRDGEDAETVSGLLAEVRQRVSVVLGSVKAARS